MPSEPVLIPIKSTLDASGFQAAQLGLNQLSASTALLTVSVGAAIYVGKAAIDNYKAQEEANNDLANAIRDSTNAQYGSVDAVDAWIASNAKYIDDQYAAKEAVASFIRAGMTEETALKLMGDALDLAAVKHISVSDAAHLLLLATQGNTKGLRDLGYTAQDLKAIIAATGATQADLTALQDKATAADKALAKAKEALKLEELGLQGVRKETPKQMEELRLKQVAVNEATTAATAAHKALTEAQNNQQSSESRGIAVADALTGKLKDGRDTTDQLTQKQRQLNIEWQNFTAHIGPPLISVLTAIVTAAETGVEILGELGDIIQHLGNLGNLKTLLNVSNQLNTRSILHTMGVPGFDQGGVVPGPPGQPVMVQALGGEEFGGRRGLGGGGEIHIHINGGLYADGPSLDRLTTAIAQRLRMVTGI